MVPGMLFEFLSDCTASHIRQEDSSYPKPSGSLKNRQVSESDHGSNICEELVVLGSLSCSLGMHIHDDICAIIFSAYEVMRLVPFLTACKYNVPYTSTC
jgi:hypothetical protein